VPAASGVAAAPLAVAMEESAEDEAELAASGTAGERGWNHRLKRCRRDKQRLQDQRASGKMQIQQGLAVKVRQSSRLLNILVALTPWRHPNGLDPADMEWPACPNSKAARITCSGASLLSAATRLPTELTTIKMVTGCVEPPSGSLQMRHAENLHQPQ